MESIKSTLFEKFKYDKLDYPEYVKGGVINSTYGVGGKKVGSDGYTRCSNSSTLNGGGVSSTDDDLENWKLPDVLIANGGQGNGLNPINIATNRPIRF